MEDVARVVTPAGAEIVEAPIASSSIWSHCTQLAHAQEQVEGGQPVDSGRSVPPTPLPIWAGRPFADEQGVANSMMADSSPGDGPKVIETSEPVGLAANEAYSENVAGAGKDGGALSSTL